MNINTAISTAAKSGFETYGSFNEGEFQHEILTCTKGKYDGEVIDIYYDFHTGKIKSVEYSTQFKGQLPTFSFPRHWELPISNGYFVIVEPQSKFVSFSRVAKDICFNDVVPAIIREYTNADYIRDFGSRVIEVPYNTETDPYKKPKYDGIKQVTIAEYLDSNVFRHLKSNCQ